MYGESDIRSTTAILYRRNASSVISPPRHHQSAFYHRNITSAVPSCPNRILGRLVHNAYRIELNGESIRKKRGRKPGEEETQ